MKTNIAKSDKMLFLIGAGKFLKGLALIIIATGALHYAGRDLDKVLTQWILWLNMDPNNRHFQTLLVKVGGFDSNKLNMVAAGSYFYSALFLTQGVGLMKKKRWAEIMTVIVTSSFLPLEIFETHRHFRLFKLAIVLLNVAIVCYLIWRLRWEKRGKPVEPF